MQNGYFFVYPAPREVLFHSGYDTLKDYRFGKKRFDHKFCPVCASSILIDFHNPDKWAVNVGRSMLAPMLLVEDADACLGSYDQRYRDGQTQDEIFRRQA